MDGLIGMFVNTVVLRTAIDGTDTFAELLAAVRDADLAAFANADLPFEQIVDELVTDRGTAASWAAFLASGTQIFRRDKSCAGTNECRATDRLFVRGGQHVSVQCNGVRQIATGNSAAVTCALELTHQ